jgi:hypothetical protein
MYSYDEVRHVHLEVTTACNARCPMCARTVCGLTAPGLDQIELTTDDVREIFPLSFLARLTGFDVCGAYGDPAVARDLLDIVALVRTANPHCAITVYTNGGARSENWWARLATLLGSPSLVVFAIDGLGDANAIYRRGVVFDKVMKNAEAFLSAGGTARWEWLAFRHNEHQIEAARVLSEQLGFVSFSVKKTARFLEPLYDFVPELEHEEDIRTFPIHDSDGVVVGRLEPPRNPELVNATARQYDGLIERFGSLDALFSTTPIQCRVLDSASVFVSAHGYAFPCCWTYVQATRAAYSGHATQGDLSVAELVSETGGFAAIDTRRVGQVDAADLLPRGLQPQPPSD